MPVFVYQCKDCDKDYEKVQGIKEEADTVCPYCGGKVFRVLQPTLVLYHGSGFYVTDYKQ